jgi:multiple sugar transport system permease protein
MIKNSKYKNLPTHIFLILLAFVMVYPIFWWIGASFKNEDEITSPGLFPAHATLSNFINGWSHAVPGYTFTHFYINNFILIAGVLFTTLIATSLVAFGFARLDFPLRNFWFSIVLVTLMLPGQVTLVPQYTMFNFFGWVNTYLPFYIPHALAAGAGGPFYVFLLVQFIRGIPRDLDEAAKMDGASWWGVYYHIILPLIKPALVTVAIYSFLWNWDDFMGHLIYINSVDKYTVDLALKMFADTQSATPWGQLFAMSLVSIIPSVIIFVILQKRIVEGVATSGLKG